jgi:hypothetical protein
MLGTVYMFANKLISQFYMLCILCGYLVTYVIIRVPTAFITIFVLLWNKCILMLMLVSFSVSSANVHYGCHMPFISFMCTFICGVFGT